MALRRTIVTLREIPPVLDDEPGPPIGEYGAGTTTGCDTAGRKAPASEMCADSFLREPASAGRRVRANRITGLIVKLVAALAVLCCSGQLRAWNRMSAETFDTLSEGEIVQWSLQQINPYSAALQRSADKHELPPRLLAACILNELADYGWEDQLQELFFHTGSIGMAQMRVDRAIEFKRVDVDPRELDACVEKSLANQRSAETGASAGPSDAAATALGATGGAEGTRSEVAREGCLQYLTWQRLNEPEHAIEAAAREIDWILDSMNRFAERPWQRYFLTAPIDRTKPYDSVRPWAEAGQSGRPDSQVDQAAREESLAVAVCSAYNAPSIIMSHTVPTSDGEKSGSSFKNARSHGRRAGRIAAALARADALARPPEGKDQTPPGPAPEGR